MRRRSFLSNLAITPALMATPAFTIASGEPVNKPETGGNKKIVVEPSREIPVIEEPDVLICGGGPAGVAAALAASRTGAKTLLVERYNHLGGLWTGGLVLPLLSTHALDEKGKYRQVIFGVGDEIAQRLKSMGMAISEVNPSVDPEAAKYVLDVMMKESGVKTLYHCWVSNVLLQNNSIQSVFLETKSGRVAVNPKIVVDCTGDGDILQLAGENFENFFYHIGLVHRLGNIDRIDKKKPGYKDMPIGDRTPIPSVNWVNMHGDDNQNGIDLYALSELQQKYRIAIWEQYQKIKKTPGYEEVFLLDTAPQLGVRMSRILDGQYRLTLDDSMTYKRFDDSIGVSGAWTNLLYKGKRIKPNERPSWQIPYRSLLPKKTCNLIAAGRCFSFEKNLVEDARIIGTCLVTGQGAGVAAAVAVSAGKTPANADIKRVQTILKEQHVNIG